MTALTAITKEIKYNRLTKDFDMTLNGEYIGSEASYHSAEVELDRLAYEQLDRAGIEPELTIPASELDGGSGQDEIAAAHNRDALARSAFWGSNPALMAELERRDGYEMDGQWHPANSMTLARCIELVATMTDAELGAALSAEMCACGHPINESGFCDACSAFPGDYMAATLEALQAHAACHAHAPGALTAAIHLDGQTTTRTHRAVAERDEYLRYNPSARIVLPVDAPRAVVSAALLSAMEPDTDPGHDIVTPDPAECPDISAPRPVEDLPGALAEPDDGEEDEDDYEEGDPRDEDVYAPPFGLPAPSSCERYSTPPSLALWGPDTPECSRCGTRHDPVVACPVSARVAVEPERGPLPPSWSDRPDLYIVTNGQEYAYWKKSGYWDTTARFGGECLLVEGEAREVLGRFNGWREEDEDEPAWNAFLITRLTVSGAVDLTG